jgi:hypothetical protein
MALALKNAELKIVRESGHFVRREAGEIFRRHPGVPAGKK